MREKIKNCEDHFLTGSCHDWPWKVSKLVPFVDRFIQDIGKDEMNLFDVRCGAGLILKDIQSHIEGSCGARVDKFA